MSVHTVFTPASCDIIHRAVATPDHRRAVDLLVANITTLCADITQHLVAPGQVDGAVMLCAYLWRHDHHDVEHNLAAYRFFMCTVGWTCLFYSEAGRATLSPELVATMVNEMQQPENELAVLKAYCALAKLVQAPYKNAFKRFACPFVTEEMTSGAESGLAFAASQ